MHNDSIPSTGFPVQMQSPTQGTCQPKDGLQQAPHQKAEQTPPESPQTQWQKQETLLRLTWRPEHPARADTKASDLLSRFVVSTLSVALHLPVDFQPSPIPNPYEKCMGKAHGLQNVITNKKYAIGRQSMQINKYLVLDLSEFPIGGSSRSLLYVRLTPSLHFRHIHPFRSRTLP